MDPKRMRRKGVRFSMREHAVLKGFRLEFNKHLHEIREKASQYS